MSRLYQEFTLKNHRLRNAIVFPPMVCFNWSDEKGLVSKDHLDHYERIAKGGVGLIVVEATAIDPNGRLHASQLGIWNEEQVDGLQKIAKIIRDHGGKSLLQIHHAGDKTPENIMKSPFAPSKYTLKNDRTTTPLTKGDIKTIQKDFLKAALRAEKAGFDGIELHGAHGYLINQFLSPKTNLRDDDYGGSFENRLRFVQEILTMIKDHLPSDFIIGYRHGGNTPDLEGGTKASKALEKMGVDLMHVSAGIYDEKDEPVVPEGFNFNWIVYTGREIKKALSIPVILVNGIREPHQAEQLIEENQGDLIAVGRGILVDPLWPKKGEEKKDVNPCLRCRPRCFYTIDGRKCPQFPEKKGNA